MDFDRLRFVSERADTAESLISVIIPERPGTFRQLYDIIYPRCAAYPSHTHIQPNSPARASVCVCV